MDRSFSGVMDLPPSFRWHLHYSGICLFCCLKIPINPVAACRVASTTLNAVEEHSKTMDRLTQSQTSVKQLEYKVAREHEVDYKVFESIEAVTCLQKLHFYVWTHFECNLALKKRVHADVVMIHAFLGEQHQLLSVFKHEETNLLKVKRTFSDSPMPGIIWTPFL